MTLGRRMLLAASVPLSLALIGPAGAVGAPPKLKRLFTVNASAAQAVPMARTADGRLHLIFQTFAGRAFSGLGAMTISAAGAPGPQVQALATWQAGQPGLIALPGGTLESVFGAVSPGNVSSVWGITSSDGGSSWTAPVDVRGGGPNEALAYGSDVTAAMSGTTPVLALPQAGNVVIQTGLGAGSPSFQLTNASNGSATDADLAVDASTGQIVAGWQSIAGNSTDYLQGAVPNVMAAQQVPGQARNAIVLAGRDTGPGVFGAYTPNGTSVSLLRHGGGSVAVGSLAAATPKALGVATGPSGRIWVMWGNESALAVTRSNKAVTRFEPIQRLNPNATTLYRVSGDGRLGPLDLLVNEIPSFKGSAPPAGEYYARVLPVLSASVSVSKVKSKGKVIAFKLTVTVTDAGDPVSGATVALKGKKAKTNGAGVAKLALPGSASGSATMTITDTGYQALTRKITL